MVPITSGVTVLHGEYRRLFDGPGEIHGFAQVREGIDEAVDRCILVIGVTLHPQDPAMIRNCREEDRLHVIATVEEEFPRVERVRLVADQDRNDRRRPSHDDQAQAGQSAGQALNVGVKPRAERVVLARAEDVDNRADGFQISKGRPAHRRRRDWSGS